jgi:hypothetical protein
MADNMSDGFARSMMLQIATMYTQLEKRAAAVEATTKVPLSNQDGARLARRPRT